jgi:hypothetical protein
VAKSSATVRSSGYVIVTWRLELLMSDLGLVWNLTPDFESRAEPGGTVQFRALIEPPRPQRTATLEGHRAAWRNGSPLRGKPHIMPQPPPSNWSAFFFVRREGRRRVLPSRA